MGLFGKTTQTIGAHFLVKLSALLLPPLVIRVSGAEVYGTYVLLLSYIIILFGISSFGIGFRSRRWLPSRDSSRDRSNLFFPQFWFQFFLVIVLAWTTAFIFSLATKHYRWNELQNIPIWIIPLFLLTHTLYSQGNDFFRFTHRVWVFNLSTTAQPWFFFGAALISYHVTLYLGIRELFLFCSIASLVVALPLWIKIHLEIGINFRLPKLAEIKSDILLGFPLVLSFLVDTVLEAGDRYIIGVLMTISDVGFYAPAYALGALPILLPRVFGVVLPPLLAKDIDTGNEAIAEKNVAAAIRAFLLLAIPFVAGSLLIGEDLLQLYLIPEAAEAAWSVLPLIAASSIFHGLMLLYANVLFVRLRTGALFRINAIAALLNLFLNFILLTVYPDLSMAALATLLSYLFSFLWVRKLLHKETIITLPELGWLLKLLMATIFMALTVYLVRYIVVLDEWARLFLICATGIIAYVIALLMLKLAKEETAFLRKRLHR